MGNPCSISSYAKFSSLKLCLVVVILNMCEWFSQSRNLCSLCATMFMCEDCYLGRWSRVMLISFGMGEACSRTGGSNRYALIAIKCCLLKF